MALGPRSAARSCAMVHITPQPLAAFKFGIGHGAIATIHIDPTLRPGPQPLEYSRSESFLVSLDSQ